jgi:uncharacterized protein (TIGR00106 family)
MRVIADICVIPINGNISLRKEVAKAHQILKNTGLPVNLHGYGTNIEGEIDEILGAIKEIHEALHQDGVQRISTSIKLGSRIDKETTIDSKILSVQQEIRERK